MTSRRNPLKRDLGPILAAAGGVVVLAAVIAGFIAVGGPGDARDERLDNVVMEKLNALASEAQCAFEATAKTYPNIAEMKSVADRTRRGNEGRTSACSHIVPDVPPSEMGSDGDPAQPGEIDYATIDESHIRLCGNFRRAYDPKRRMINRYGYMSENFPEFARARPVGKHCYEIELLPPMKPAPPTDDTTPTPP